MLIKDSCFTPCPAAPNDEVFQLGIFEFNITKMIDHIHTHPSEFIPEDVSVDEFHAEHSRINQDHMDSVQLNEPVIIAEISPGNYVLIDGNHRMEKARRLGMNKVSAYRLNVNRHMHFLTSKEAYLAYVGYWNDKL